MQWTSIWRNFATNCATPAFRTCGFRKGSAGSMRFPFLRPVNSISGSARSWQLKTASAGCDPKMRQIFHRIANRAAALFMKLLFGYSSRVYVVGLENTKRAGGFLLASNHISHFDPFIISSVVERKIDWMAMAEFFPLPIVGLFLRAVDA